MRPASFVASGHSSLDRALNWDSPDRQWPAAEVPFFRMPGQRFSTGFGLGKSQSELDFVDVDLTTDTLLFVDPFALSVRPDDLSRRCHRTLVAYFQRIVDTIRADQHDAAKKLLLSLSEPNETRLGYSEKKPQGAGIGWKQAGEIFEALKGSAAVKTGFLNALEECELMIDGISRDKISDLTTNVIRAHLVEYTREQCKLHGVPTQKSALPPLFNDKAMAWESHYAEIPVWKNSPVLLVPKIFVRWAPSYYSKEYYSQYVLEFLQAEELSAGSSLVRTLKRGDQVVYKKDVAEKYPFSKDFLYEFSKKHPEVLKKYRADQQKRQKRDLPADVDPIDQDPEIAEALATALKSIPVGPEAASTYHKLMVGVVEFLLFPKLLYPQKEAEIHEGRKRIDIVMENSAEQGVFHSLPTLRQYPCAYVFFECKNYKTDVENPELDQLAGRFSPNRGKVGFMCCRTFENRDLFIQRCRDTFKDDRGLIVPLEDVAVLSLLDLVRKGERARIDEAMSQLIGEVWLA
jgi:hypothetical protein